MPITRTKPRKTRQMTVAATVAARGGDPADPLSSEEADSEPSVKEVAPPPAKRNKVVSKRGRPTLEQQKLSTALATKGTEFLIRVGFAKKPSPSSTKPKEWPQVENLYHTFCTKSQPKRFEQLWGKIKSLVEEDDRYNKYEMFENTVDHACLFADSSGSGSDLRQFPFNNEKMKGDSWLPISGDSSLSTAFEKHASVVDLTEACSSDDEASSDSDESLGAPRVPETKEKVLLDVLVWVKLVKKVTTKPAKKKQTYDNVRFEIMPLAEKYDDKTVQTSSLQPIAKLTLTKNIVDQMRIGQLRKHIANHALENILTGYVEINNDEDEQDPVLFFGKHSAVYYRPHHGQRDMQALVSTAAFRDAIQERASKRGDKTTVVISVALAKMQSKDEQYELPSDDDEDHIGESQLQDFFYSPGKHQTKKKGSRRGAKVSMSANIDTEDLISRLNNEPESPYYWGITERMATKIEQRCHDNGIATTIKERLDNKEWPSEMELFGPMLTPNDPRPKRGEYEPIDGKPRPVPIQEKRSAVEMMATAVAKLAGGQDGDSSVDKSRCFFRFSREGVPRTTDVRVNCLKKGFTGQDLFNFAFDESNKRKQGVFNMDDETADKIMKKEASIYFVVVESGLEIESSEFKKLKHEELLCHFTTNTKVEFAISVLDNVATVGSVDESRSLY